MQDAKREGMTKLDKNKHLIIHGEKPVKINMKQIPFLPPSIAGQTAQTPIITRRAIRISTALKNHLPFPIYLYEVLLLGMSNFILFHTHYNQFTDNVFFSFNGFFFKT